MDIQEILAYTHQLQFENSQLKKHIYNIQQQLQQKNQANQLIQQKTIELNQHIKLCQNQIIKRQRREAQLSREYEDSKKDINLYIEELDRLKNQLAQQKIDNENLLKEISRKGTGIPPKSQSSKRKTKQNDILPSNLFGDPLEVKEEYQNMRNSARNRQNQCSKCVTLMENNSNLVLELQKQKSIEYQLQRDLQCLVHTISLTI